MSEKSGGWAALPGWDQTKKKKSQSINQSINKVLT